MTYKELANQILAMPEKLQNKIAYYSSDVWDEMDTVGNIAYLEEDDMNLTRGSIHGDVECVNELIEGMNLGDPYISCEGFAE